MLRADPSSPAWRVFAAFICAPLGASLAFACILNIGVELDGFLSGVQTWVLSALFVTVPLTLLAGVPAYAFLRDTVRPSLRNCTLAGAGLAAIPGLPIAVGILAVEQPIYGKWTDAGVGLLGIMVPGAVGGVVFWLVAAVRRA